MICFSKPSLECIGKSENEFPKAKKYPNLFVGTLMKHLVNKICMLVVEERYGGRGKYKKMISIILALLIQMYDPTYIYYCSTQYTVPYYFHT